MSPADDRGSTKLLHELFGGKVPESHEEVARALGVKADSVKLLRWWVKEHPGPTGSTHHSEYIPTWLETSWDGS